VRQTLLFVSITIPTIILRVTIRIIKNTFKLLTIGKRIVPLRLRILDIILYFGLSGSALSQETEFDVAEDASKSQIKSAFAKSLKSKKMNKKILGEFIDLVA